MNVAHPVLPKIEDALYIIAFLENFRGSTHI